MARTTFNFTGAEQTFSVPSGISEATLEAYGAEGGNSGGQGGYVRAEVVSVTGGETLYVYVGGAGTQPAGGFNGGADGGTSGANGTDGGGGGGASDIRQGGNTTSDRIVIGGGGGGDGGDASGAGGFGGDGGNPAGGDGADGADFDVFVGGAGGTGGDQSSGGTAGDSGNSAPLGTDGSLADGGAGGDGANGGPGGAGGAGGYYGGAGGQGGQNESGGGGAGGGSSTVLVSADNTVYSDGIQSGDGQVVITTLEAPSGLTATAIDGDQIDLSWTDNSTDETGFRVYRSTDPGVTINDTQVADLPANTTSYSDTGLDDGTEYHYIVTSYDNGLEQESNEDSAITDLPAPTNLASPTQADTSIDITWTDNHDNGQTRVDYKLTTDGSYTTFSTLALNTESETITGLLNGETYDIRVVALTDDASTIDT